MRHLHYNGYWTVMTKVVETAPRRADEHLHAHMGIRGWKVVLPSSLGDWENLIATLTLLGKDTREIFHPQGRMPAIKELKMKQKFQGSLHKGSHALSLFIHTYSAQILRVKNFFFSHPD